MNENKNNINIGDDPTLSLSLQNIPETILEEEYNKLTNEEKILIGCKLLGMDHKPTTIRRFLCDDYFLGSELIFNHGKAIFTPWYDKLEEIFPNPIKTDYPFVSMGGCVGSGKSSISRVIGLYFLHRLDCCSNVYISLGMAGGMKLAFGFFHANFETAKRDFKNYYDFIFDTSPYFRNQYHKPPIRMIPSGPVSVGAVLGTQLVFSIISECGFWRPQDGVNKVSEVITRYNSRFADKRYTFGGAICDSSAKDASDAAPKKFEELVDPNDLLKIKWRQWDIRPNLFNYDVDKRTFRFYKGDAIQGPRVIEDDEDISVSGLDADRIINIPISAKFQFLADPIRNLRDLAGEGYTGSENFFGGNLSHLINCSRLKNYAPEEIIVDFYDKEDSIYSHVSNMIYRIPRGTSLFVHFDIGLKKDKTGVALCYYDGEKQYGEYSLPKFKIPLAFDVSRKKGQATSLDHLYQFLKDLIKNGYIVEFSADSFASAGLLQSAERDSIPYRALSVDKTMEAYNMFKNIVNSERLELPYINILLRECSELMVTYNGKNGEHCKVDHPLVSKCTEFDYADNPSEKHPGSKDLADAVVGAVFNCYSRYAEYKETGISGGVNKTIEAFGRHSLTGAEESQKVFQDMLVNLF